MSRTYKDRPLRVKYPDKNEYKSVPYIASGKHWATGEPYERLRWYMLKKPYIKPKEPKRVNTTWHWMGSTPSSWTNMFMNRPQRNASNQYMRQVTLDVDLEEVDPPPLGRKPHIYYW